jgi:hypothetical protein
MITEPRDDTEFLHWLDAHPTGFVLNCYRKPSASYLQLHRTTCRTLRGLANYAGGDYRKVCSVHRNEIEQWASERTGGAVTLCGTCNPDG